MGRGGFWPEDDGTEKEFGGWEGREVADKCWDRGEEGGQEPSSAWLALEGGWLSTAGSWPPDKGSAAEGESREGARAAQLGSGLAQPWGTLSHSLGCTMGSPSRLPCNTPNPCTQTSAKGRAHSLEQVADFLPAVGFQLC